MWIEDKNNPTMIKMVEGDYGITLPIELDLEGETIASSDCFKIRIFEDLNTEPTIEKTYSNISNNTIDFSLTEAESSLLSVGSYLYDLDWYQENSFLSNIVAKKKFVVSEKAGEVSSEG